MRKQASRKKWFMLPVPRVTRDGAGVRALCFILPVLLILISGCREIATETRIFPDGSCERTVTASGDSSSILDGTLPIPVDSSWAPSWTRKRMGSNGPTYSAHKTFREVSDLGTELSRSVDSVLSVRVSVQFQKKFRWFSTLYQYGETYHASNPFTGIPVSDYLNDEEMRLYLINEDTLSLKTKAEAWFERSMFEEIFQALVQVARESGEPGLTEELLISKKEAIFEAVKQKDLEKPEDILIAFEEATGCRALRKMKVPFMEILEQAQEKSNFLQQVTTDAYTCGVTMPGLIIETNAKSVQGSRAQWEFEGKQFLWKDYVMNVESRRIHLWSVALSAGIVLVLLAALVFSRRGK
ncbi:hypothetical protein JW906_08785 [bacterium]|nr:hypothetical protein [bacterium]